MHLDLWRFATGRESTLGFLRERSETTHRSLCFILEDQEQAGPKVRGETRIPAGEYRITLRTEGGFHERYGKLFPDIHQGMLWLRDVPGFEYVLIHCGNSDDDTDGCLIVGDTLMQNFTRDGSVAESQVAYRRVYPPIAAALLAGEEVRIRIQELAA